jgi:hypothetical protein
LSADGGDAQALNNDGLEQLFAMVLAGLAARTLRMVSATLMALARLTFEFAPQLQAVAAQLLPAVCALLRSKAREVIKSVLGFLKVAAMRVPVELLTPHLKDILDGVLLWAEDTKNRYKLKVRHLVERLIKRCSYDAVAAAWPESEAKLLTAVRKEFARSARRKAMRAAAGAEAGETEGGSRGAHSMARTARASEWHHSAVFSDGGSAATGAARTQRSKGTARTGAQHTHDCRTEWHCLHGSSSDDSKPRAHATANVMSCNADLDQSLARGSASQHACVQAPPAGQVPAAAPRASRTTRTRRRTCSTRRRCAASRSLRRARPNRRPPSLRATRSARW